MKNTIKAVIAAIAIVSAQFAFAAGGPVPPTPVTPPVNPLDIARAFVLKTPDYYQGQLTGNFLVGNEFQFKVIDFRMEKNFSITSLLVGETVIPLPEPIYGLPMGDGGLIRNACLYINGMTSTGEYAGSGRLDKLVVTKGESLVVELIPADIAIEIPVDPSQFNSLRVEIDNFPYGYGWGGNNGKFYIYLPPVGGRYHYVLRNSSTGIVVGEGWLEPFNATETPSDAYVGVKYAGGVLGAEFTQPDGIDEWLNVASIEFDCNIPLNDGSSGIGKVVFVDCKTGGLQIDIWNSQCTVFIQSATASGDMPFLALEDRSNPNGSTRVNTVNKNIGKVVVTIIPISTSPWRPWLNLHRFYGSPANTGDGGTTTVGVVGNGS
jgi:hypothetical protein